MTNAMLIVELYYDYGEMQAVSRAAGQDLTRGVREIAHSIILLFGD